MEMEIEKEKEMEMEMEIEISERGHLQKGVACFSESGHL